MKKNQFLSVLASASLIFNLITPVVANATSVSTCPSLFISDSSNQVTKIEYVKVLLNSDGFDPTSISTSSFTDVLGDDKSYAEKMKQLGVVNFDSYNPLFRPDEAISLKSALDILFKYKGILVPQTVINPTSFKNKVKNVSTGAIFAPVIEKALSLGLVNPTNGNVQIFDKISPSIANFVLCKYGNPNAVVARVTVITPDYGNSGIQNEAEFKILTDVWRRITNDFYGKDSAKKSDLLYGAISGMVARLGDKHSVFQEPSLQKAFKDSLSGQIEGIGASLAIDDNGNLSIVAPLAGSPSEKAGLRPNDIIEKIDGVTIRNLTLLQSISKIKGNAGTRVTLTINRSGTIKDYVITRAVVDTPAISVEITANNVAIFTIRNFGSGLGAAFTKYANQLKVKTIKGIVIDLRNNPGGYLDEAVEIAGHFLSKDEIVTKVSYVDQKFSNDKSAGPSDLKGIPLVVLINGGSASASEILAVALHDKAGAKLVGEKSYGKGTVQELINYDDDSALKLTIAHWLSPLGTDINGVGIMPDITIKNTDADLKLGNDAQLNRGLGELSGKY